MVLMIILLILALPLILMLSLYTTTSVVTIVADVPVTGIELNIDRYSIDLDSDAPLVIDYTVNPHGATNKEVYYTFIDVATGEEVDAFEVTEEGLIPKLPGSIEILIETADGGFIAKFPIQITTKRVVGIDSSVEKDGILVGESVTVSTVFTPSNAANQALTYSVKEGSDIVKVSPGGVIKGIGIGTAVIEVTSVGDPSVKDEITVSVGSSGVFDFVDAEDYLTVLESRGSIDVILNPALSGFAYETVLTDLSGGSDPKDIVGVALDIASGKLEYEFIDTDFVGDIEVALTVTADGTDGVTKICRISRISDISIEWNENSVENEYAIYFGEALALEVDVQPKTADVTYLLTAEFKSGTDLSGDVEAGVQIELTEGVKYSCDGGYVSIMSDGSSIVVYADRAATDIQKVSETLTKLHIFARDNTTGEIIDLGVKIITVI